MPEIKFSYICPETRTKDNASKDQIPPLINLSFTFLITLQYIRSSKSKTFFDDQLTTCQMEQK